MNAETFSDKVTDSYIYGVNKFLGVSDSLDIETGEPTFYVRYELQPEAREWGLKGIDIYILSVVANVEWEVYSEFLTDEEKAQLIKVGGVECRNETIIGSFNINSTDEGWTVTNEVEFKPSGYISIEQVSVDLNKKSIEVS